MNTTDRRTRPCSHCGQVLAHEQLIPFQDELLCPACLDEQTTVCSCCGERIYKTDNSGTDTIPLCEDCYDNHYERCTHCGTLIHRRDTYYRGDDPYCYDCYHTLPAQGINDYYFKPEPIFYGTGKRYFGVELEVDEGGESDSNAERVLDIANTGNELIYCKHDGSLNPVCIKRAWQALGYALVPDNRAKRFIVMQGVGDSGKSVFGNLISAFFDPSAVANVDIFKFRERFATAELVDKRVNISMDLPAGNLSDQAVGMLKKITGGDAVTVEEKYHSPRSAVINATLIFGTNHELRLWEFDEAFANRVLLIPFQYPVPEEQRDPKLLESLKAERSGILYRAILEYRELVENGYVFAGDDVISFQAQCVERGVIPPDGVAEFVSACCIMDAEHFTSTEQLHLAYLDFCREHHLPSLNDRGAFSRQFSAAVGFAAKREKQRVNGVPMNGYRGVMLAGGVE